MSDVSVGECILLIGECGVKHFRRANTFVCVHEEYGWCVSECGGFCGCMWCSSYGVSVWVVKTRP